MVMDMHQQLMDRIGDVGYALLLMVVCLGGYFMYHKYYVSAPENQAGDQAGNQAGNLAGSKVTPGPVVTNAPASNAPVRGEPKNEVIPAKWETGVIEHEINTDRQTDQRGEQHRGDDGAVAPHAQEVDAANPASRHGLPEDM